MQPATPFPELRALESPSYLPSLEELLEKLPKGGKPLPAPQAHRSGEKLPVFPTEPSGFVRASSHRADENIHPFPGTSGGTGTSSSLPTFPSSSDLPPAASQPSSPAENSPLPPIDETPAPETGTTAPDCESPAPHSEPTPDAAAPSSYSPIAMATSSAMEDEDEVTDDELRRAFEPIVESSLERVLYAPDKGLHTYLEPMLRSTVRRAIAEQIDTAVQFRSTGPMDRLGWRLKALLTSRTYDEIVFQSTRRYQVEEAYLLRKEDFSLISYASHDPARHASTRKVQSTVKSISTRLYGSDRRIVKSFDFPENRIVIVREGEHAILAAVVRGRSNALVRADLDYVLRQAEERFGERLEDESDAFIHVLQPILEGCLLIQSPAPPN
ncbi:MAG: hypothetical protein Q7Q71_07495 [Verrucomicrobiota bacterium JB023]|nr:hypothetical protein [Verrucomicrobiota bacterium JB023]